MGEPPPMRAILLQSRGAHSVRPQMSIMNESHKEILNFHTRRVAKEMPRIMGKLSKAEARLTEMANAHMQTQLLLIEAMQELEELYLSIYEEEDTM